MKLSSCFLAFSLALAVAAPCSTAMAQGAPTKAARDEASSRFRKGIELFKDGDYHAALIEFRRAYELVPDWKVLYNIGQVQFQLQDYAGALTTLERYLAEGGKQIPSSRKAEVEKDIQKLKTRIAQIDISINVQDAEIAVDDVIVAKGPFNKPITVSAGRHKITASHEGYLSSTKVVDLASNDTVKLNFDLQERGGSQTTSTPDGTQNTPLQSDPSDGTPSTAPSVPPDTTPPDDSSSSSVPWAAWALTGGLAAGAIGFGVAALGASSDLKELRGKPTTSKELDDASSKTTTFAVLSDVFTGAAVIVGGVSLYLTIRDASSPSENVGSTAQIKRVRIAVVPSGVMMTGSF